MRALRLEQQPWRQQRQQQHYSGKGCRILAPTVTADSDCRSSYYSINCVLITICLDEGSHLNSNNSVHATPMLSWAGGRCNNTTNISRWYSKDSGTGLSLNRSRSAIGVEADGRARLHTTYSFNRERYPASTNEMKIPSNKAAWYTSSSWNAWTNQCWHRVRCFAPRLCLLITVDFACTVNLQKSTTNVSKTDLLFVCCPFYTLWPHSRALLLGKHLLSSELLSIVLKLLFYCDLLATLLNDRYRVPGAPIDHVACVNQVTIGASLGIDCGVGTSVRQ